MSRAWCAVVVRGAALRARGTHLSDPLEEGEGKVLVGMAEMLSVVLITLLAQVFLVNLKA